MTSPTEGILILIRARTDKIAYRRVLESLPQVVVDQTFKTALVSTSYISNTVFFFIVLSLLTVELFDLSQSCLLRVYGTPKLHHME